ncbi:hypothetical protein DYD21_17515 [Rhodohalobacter sp. SW132]|uniref:DUF6807 family protein n=1 Tax=Rhodohalobacter sp. SW132 TaxID=2293433 RepID=UPI000E23481E|nr:DUF6807 family protein [Rhodohalobacter sp. SW132]REL24657.1 hypothetical protein DYD21_17515 [Rhodohalobacter sp. SW132]
MRFILTVLFIVLFSASCGNNTNHTFQYTAGNHDLEGALVYTDLELEDTSGELCLETGGELIPAQAEPLSSDGVRVWWQATLPAGETIEYTIHKEQNCSDTEFSWQRTGEQSVQLQHDGQPLIQYEHPVFDTENIEETKKPFHHVFDPVSGDLITKGLGGLYPHHRGIFFGYNQLRIDEKQLDIWHANEGERSEHEEFEEEISGPVFGGHIVQIHWKDHDGNVMLNETRDIRAFRYNDHSFFIDFHTKLTSVAGPAELAGDLQHAGVQFRAAQYVADHSEETQFIRPGEWSHYPSNEELGEEEWENVPWNAMQYSIDENSYTVAYMSHTSNPGPSEMSERKYGRFGEFIPYSLDEDESLELRYRFWIVSGDTISAEEIEQQFQIYSDQTVE